MIHAHVLYEIRNPYHPIHDSYTTKTWRYHAQHYLHMHMYPPQSRTWQAIWEKHKRVFAKHYWYATGTVGYMAGSILYMGGTVKVPAYWRGHLHI
jgi:hypothetical protein